MSWYDGVLGFSSSFLIICTFSFSFPLFFLMSRTKLFTYTRQKNLAIGMARLHNEIDDSEESGEPGAAIHLRRVPLSALERARAQREAGHLRGAVHQQVVHPINERRKLTVPLQAELDRHQETTLTQREAVIFGLRSVLVWFNYENWGLSSVWAWFL